MRAPHIVGLAGVVALLLVGMVVLLTTSQPTPPTTSGSLPVVETSAAAEGDPESRPHEVTPAVPIRPVPFAEIPADQPDPAITPAEIVLTGDVLDWDGTPATSVGVSVFRMRDGAPAGEPCARADTDGQGRFRLVISGSDLRECVLAAFKPARRPATLALATSGFKNGVRLTLGIGAAIEGTITLDGRPARSARVSAAIMSEGLGSLSERSPLWWSGAAFETKAAAVYCDEEGRFVLRGLASETYRVETEPLVSEPSIDLACQAVVPAPASGVHLGVQSANVRIRVLGMGEPLPLARVAVIDSRGVRMGIGELTDLHVASGLPFTVEAAHLGFAPKQVAVPALAAGESRNLDVVLDPEEKPDLRLKLRGASEMYLSRVAVRFIPISRHDEEGVCVVKELRRDLYATRDQESQYTLGQVPYPSGNYILLLLPELHETWFQPIQTEIVLPARGSLEVDLEVARGGRLNVIMLGRDSSPASGDYVLRDAAGAEVFSSAAGRTSPSGDQDARAEASSLRRSTGVFAPGTYELEAKSAGFRTIRRNVTVTAGSRTDEVIRLEPEAP